MSAPDPQNPDDPMYQFVDTQPTSPEPNNPDSSQSHFTTRQLTPTAITNAMPPVVTATTHGLLQSDYVRATKFIEYPVANATGMEQLNNKIFKVGFTTTNTFQLYTIQDTPLDARNYTPYVSGGQFTRIGPSLEIVNPSTFPTS